MPFTDNFTGTNGDYLESRTGWTRSGGVAGALQIGSANQLKSASTTRTAYQSPDCGSADHYVQALVPLAAQWYNQWFAVRVTDPANGIFARKRVAYGDVQIYAATAGTFTKLASIAHTPIDGSTYKLEASGNTITLYCDGSPIVSATTSAHNTVTTAGLMSDFSTYDPWIDDYEATQAPVGGTTPVYADLGLVRAVRASIAADLGLVRALRAAAIAEATFGREIRNAVAGDAVLGRVVRGAATGDLGLRRALRAAIADNLNLRRLFLSGVTPAELELAIDALTDLALEEAATSIELEAATMAALTLSES